MQMTSSNDLDHNSRPRTPTEDECCGNGCESCIFDIHKQKLKEWNEKKFNKSSVPAKLNYLCPLRYNKFKIKDITEASTDCIYIDLDCELDNKDNVLFLYPSQHVVLKLESISKPYTPISWSSKSLKLLIKIYPNGKASSCIKQLKISDEVFIRGPYGDFEYKRNSFKQILMFSIGTGIAVFYPLAKSIVENELEDTKINLIAGFQTLSHVPLKYELRLLADYWNFECTLCLSQKSSGNITGLEMVNSRLNVEILKGILGNYEPESSLVLICGTIVFNEFLEKTLIEKKFLHYHVFK